MRRSRRWRAWLAGGLLVAATGAALWAAWTRVRDPGGAPPFTRTAGWSPSASPGPPQKDIGFTSISPDPAPAAARGALRVRAKLDAPGFEGLRVKVRLALNGEVQKVQDFELAKATDNEIEIATKAPDKPGEVKVSLELVDPPLNQSTTRNDKIDTDLTITREGVRYWSSATTPKGRAEPGGAPDTGRKIG